jgi:hypothetical protein
MVILKTLMITKMANQGMSEIEHRKPFELYGQLLSNY